MIHEDCSSVNTFDGVCDEITKQRPAAFILENVDSMDTKPKKNENGDELPPTGLISVMAQLWMILWMYEIGRINDMIY